MSAAPPRPARNTLPVILPEARRFSTEDDAFVDPITLVQRVKGIAPLMRILDGAKFEYRFGPKRGPGNWALLYLSFVVGGHVHLQPWCKQNSRDARLWRECGFAGPVPHKSVAERFAELEQKAEVFTEAHRYLIQLARRHNPMIGAHVFVDGTECQTHAATHHDCGPNDDCAWRGNGGQPQMVDADTAARLRQAESEYDEVATPAPQAATSTTPGLRPVPPRQRTVTSDGGVRFTANGHWWRSRDREAGTRSYGAGRYWNGSYVMKEVDYTTGGTLAVDLIPANVNEHKFLPELYRQGVAATGINPVALSADKGFAVDAIYDFLITRDTTPVIPKRQRSPQVKPEDEVSKLFDDHGVPYCRHCGTPGDFVRFDPDNGGPRLTFRCSLPSTPACAKDQTISCRKGIRRLLPLWRTGAVYAALRKHHSTYEQTHAMWRTRFRVGGKTKEDRIRRLGIACARLRAKAAMFIEWVWILARQGWLTGSGARVAPRTLDGGDIPENIAKRRRDLHLLGGGYPKPRPAPTAA